MKKVIKVRLSKEQVRFLEELAQCPKSNGGKRISKSGVIRAILKAVHNTPPNVSGVRNERELAQKLLDYKVGDQSRQ